MCVPGCCGWPRLGFSVSDDTNGHQLGLIHHRAPRHRQRIPELAALVDRPGRLGIDVGREPGGGGEPGDERFEARAGERVFGVEPGDAAFHVEAGEDGGRAVAGLRGRQD